jgi:hypothetical protein
VIASTLTLRQSPIPNPLGALSAAVENTLDLLISDVVMPEPQH